MANTGEYTIKIQSLMDNKHNADKGNDISGFVKVLEDVLTKSFRSMESTIGNAIADALKKSISTSGQDSKITEAMLNKVSATLADTVKSTLAKNISSSVNNDSTDIISKRDVTKNIKDVVTEVLTKHIEGLAKQSGGVDTGKIVKEIIAAFPTKQLADIAKILNEVAVLRKDPVALNKVANNVVSKHESGNLTVDNLRKPVNTAAKNVVKTKV